MFTILSSQRMKDLSIWLFVTEVDMLNSDSLVHAMMKGEEEWKRLVNNARFVCENSACSFCVEETYRSHMCGNESQFVTPSLRDLFANRRGSITEMLAMLGKAKRVTHFGKWLLQRACAAAVQHLITLFSSLSWNRMCYVSKEIWTSWQPLLDVFYIVHLHSAFKALLENISLATITSLIVLLQNTSINQSVKEFFTQRLYSVIIYSLTCDSEPRSLRNVFASIESLIHRNCDALKSL